MDNVVGIIIFWRFIQCCTIPKEIEFTFGDISSDVKFVVLAKQLSSKEVIKVGSDNDTISLSNNTWIPIEWTISGNLLFDIPNIHDN